MTHYTSNIYGSPDYGCFSGVEAAGVDRGPISEGIDIISSRLKRLLTS